MRSLAMKRAVFRVALALLACFALSKPAAAYPQYVLKG